MREMNDELQSLEQLEKNIGIAFRERAILRQALLHTSYVYETGGNPWESNERLEFLGDALLGYVVAEFLCQVTPPLSEGEMTKLRASLVNGDVLATVASSMHLGDHLLLGRGEQSTGGRERPANLGRAYEALIGAILLDRGEEEARQFILTSLERELRKVQAGEAAVDYKSQLQEVVQRRRQSYPTYRVIREEGPSHSKEFTVEVLVENRVMGTGSGSSKQAAEKAAAAMALRTLIENSQ